MSQIRIRIRIFKILKSLLFFSNQDPAIAFFSNQDQDPEFIAFFSQIRILSLLFFSNQDQDSLIFPGSWKFKFESLLFFSYQDQDPGHCFFSHFRIRILARFWKCRSKSLLFFSYQDQDPGDCFFTFMIRILPGLWKFKRKSLLFSLITILHWYFFTYFQIRILPDSLNLIIDCVPFSNSWTLQRYSKHLVRSAHQKCFLLSFITLIGEWKFKYVFFKKHNPITKSVGFEGWYKY